MILTMILGFGPFFENVETSLYRNISTFLEIGHFLKIWKCVYKERFPHFLILAIFYDFLSVSIPHCPVDYFIPYCCLDDIFYSSHFVSRTE